MSEFEVELPVFSRVPDGVPAEEAAARLAEIARAVRRRDVVMIWEAGQGHIGGDFSVIDILVALYFAAMTFDPAHPEDPARDRLVLSKGHTASALYCVLAALGVIEARELSRFLEPGSGLGGHPNRNHVPGVEANTGPLGHGLPIAAGMALAAKLQHSPSRCFVVVGDGELEEGSNWEALMTAAKQELGNLVVIVDRNHLQQGATTEETTGLASVSDKLAAFGCEVRHVDGHDYLQLLAALGGDSTDRRQPLAVVAHTVKGHPVSFMSNNVSWHHRVPSSDEVRIALAELEGR